MKMTNTSFTSMQNQSFLFQQLLPSVIYLQNYISDLNIHDLDNIEHNLISIIDLGRKPVYEGKKRNTSY